MTSTKPLVTSKNQERQEELVEQAKALPGVAEAIAVYGALQPYASLALVPANPKVTYATGGNK